jgi:hypothetical protein
MTLGLVGGGFTIAGIKAAADIGQIRNTGMKTSIDLGDISGANVRNVFAAGDEGRLAQAFEAANTSMSRLGWRYMLKRAYEGALRQTRTVTDKQAEDIAKELADAGGKWSNARKIIKKYEHELGGVGTVYQKLRSLAYGTVEGRRMMDVSMLIKDVSSRYAGSQMHPGGTYWQDLFGGVAKEGVWETTAVDPRFTEAARRLTTATGVQFEAGVRLPNRPRYFQAGVQGNFPMNVPGVKGPIEMPFVEFRVGGSQSKTFLSIPYVPESLVKKGLSYVATDHRGMSFSAVPHFSIPTTGGNYKVVSSNQALNVFLFGSEEGPGVEGLAQKIANAQREGKNYRTVVNDFQTVIRSQFRSMSTAGERVMGLMHQESVVPMHWIMGGGWPGNDANIGLEDIEDYVKGMERSGIRLYSSGSPGPIASQMRLSLRDFDSEWEVFGANYPVERRFLQRFRPFEITPAASSTMRDNPILGMISRGAPITARGPYLDDVVRQGHEIPHLVTAFSLGGAKHLSPEEMVVFPEAGKMLETRTIDEYVVRTKGEFPRLGRMLEGGDIIGEDYKTGETILSKAKTGRVHERVIHATSYGNSTRLLVERVFPFQDKSKIFGPKAQLRAAPGTRAQVAEQEYPLLTAVQQKRMRAAGLRVGMFNRWVQKMEAIGSSELLKKNPAEVRKQMAEAMTLLATDKYRNPGLTLGMRGTAWSLDKFVTSSRFRRSKLERFAKATGKYGPEIAMLKQAIRWGMSPEEVGMMGGYFFQKMLGGGAGAAKTIRKAGISQKYVRGMQFATFAIGLPGMHAGDYPLYRPWKGGSVEPRALMEIMAQGWKAPSGANVGELLAGEISRKIVPRQSVEEMTLAAKIAGGERIPKDMKTISSVREAKALLGTEGFVFSPDEQMRKAGAAAFYVPKAGDPARGVVGASEMGFWTPEVGAEATPQSLRAKYSRYFNAIQRAVRSGKPEDLESVKVTQGALRSEIQKQLHVAYDLRGKVVGSVASPASRAVPPIGEPPMYQTYKNVDEFINASNKGQFTLHLGKETANEMWRNLEAAAASQEERAFIASQRKAFETGEEVAGWSLRHPTHRPQSLMPTKLALYRHADEGIFYTRSFMDYAGEALDVSLAHGQKLDFDWDVPIVSAITDHKVAKEVDSMLNTTRYKREYVEQVQRSEDLRRLAKQAAKGPDKEVARGIEGLRRLIGVKLSTGPLSKAVSDMRMVSAFAASEEEFKLASTLLAEMEEFGAIASKHGFAGGGVASRISNFVNDIGYKPNEEMLSAWTDLFGSRQLVTGQGITFDAEEWVQKFSKWKDISDSSGAFEAYKKTVRAAATIKGGGVLKEPTTKELAEVALAYESGDVGGAYGLLTKQMRKGAGSAIPQARTASLAAGRWARIGIQAIKKHWKYPAVGLAAAVGISYVTGRGDLDMPSAEGGHDQMATALASGSAPAEIALPNTMRPRVVTAGGGFSPTGFNMDVSQDLTGPEARDFMRFSSTMQGMGLSVNSVIRDDRGSITPQYIDKALEERYV